MMYILAIVFGLASWHQGRAACPPCTVCQNPGPCGPDDCVPFPCQNGGTCIYIQDRNAVECVCTTGYAGRLCEKDICDLQPSHGSCDGDDGDITRYFWDSERELCDEFSFSGCLGNENNFITVAECEALCGPEMSTSTSDATTVSLTTSEQEMSTSTSDATNVSLTTSEQEMSTSTSDATTVSLTTSEQEMSNTTSDATTVSLTTSEQGPTCPNGSDPWRDPDGKIAVCTAVETSKSQSSKTGDKSKDCKKTKSTKAPKASSNKSEATKASKSASKKSEATKASKSASKKSKTTKAPKSASKKSKSAERCPRGYKCVEGVCCQP